jgi:hypothetical protein
MHLFGKKKFDYIMDSLEDLADSDPDIIRSRDANPFWSLSWRKIFKGGTKG